MQNRKRCERRVEIGVGKKEKCYLSAHLRNNYASISTKTSLGTEDNGYGRKRYAQCDC